MAHDQSNRHADLSPSEEESLRGGCHVLVAHRTKPRAVNANLATAAHFAAESTTDTNVEVCTTEADRLASGRRRALRIG